MVKQAINIKIGRTSRKCTVRIDFAIDFNYSFGLCDDALPSPAHAALTSARRCSPVNAIRGAGSASSGG